IQMLHTRLHQQSQPYLDPSGVIYFRGRSTTISILQTDLLDVLVANFQQVVSRSLLLTCLAANSETSPTRNALDLHIMRLRRRLRSLELNITTAWGRGYLFEPCERTYEATTRSGTDL